MSNRSLDHKALELLMAGEPVVIAILVAHTSPTSRHMGSRLLVHHDGKVYGSIGGGPLETRAIKLAQAALTDGESRNETLVMNRQPDKYGRIYREEAEIFIYRLNPENPNWVKLYQQILGCDRGWLITRVTPPEGQWLVRSDGTLTGVGDLDPGSSTALLDQEGRLDPGFQSAGEARFFTIPITRSSRLFIFGAGQIGRQLASLSAMTDFEVMVLDDHPERLDRAQFPTVQRLAAVESYAESLENLEIDTGSYLIFLHENPAQNETLLRQALRTPARFIGMRGTRDQWQAISATLRNEGFSKSELARVQYPIGLAIEAETPAEIAVSILAQLIQARSEHGADKHP